MTNLTLSPTVPPGAPTVPSGGPTAPQGALTDTPTPLPWYRVWAPFSWITAPRPPTRLRPAGHAAWVERIQQPAMVVISTAFMLAGVYTLGKDYVVSGLSAIGRGDKVQIVPLLLALFVIVVTGIGIEIALLTSASQLRMHLLRGMQDFWWIVVSAVMLLFCISVEGLTCTYMFYQIEHPRLGPGLTQFMQNVPILLFFVRAVAGLICLAYLIIGVLPFVIRMEDVRREMAAQAGAAKVAIIQRLLHVIDKLSVRQMLALFEPISAIFRDNAGYTSSQQAHRLVIDTLQQVRDQFNTLLVGQVPVLAVVDQVIVPLQQSFHEKGAGAELEQYDKQTHAALTRLQDQLSAQYFEADANGISPADFQAYLTQLQTMQEELRHLTDSNVSGPEMEYQLKAWADQVAQQFEQKLAALSNQFAALVAQKQPAASFSTSGAAGSDQDSAHMAPAGTNEDDEDMGNPPPPARKKSLVAGANRAFVAALRDANNRLIQRKVDTSLFNLASELGAEGIGPDDIKAVLEQLNEQRHNRLRGNQQLTYDALLDGVSLT